MNRVKLFKKAIPYIILASFIGYYYRQYIPVTSPFLYNWGLTKWDTGDIAHFPEKISDASNVKFYFNYGALQAATVIELRYTLGKEAFDKELIRLAAQKTSEQGERNKDDYTFSFFTLESEERNFEHSHSLPTGFQVKLLHARARAEYNGEISWNHGESHGYSWNENTLEIIYWAESW